LVDKIGQFVDFVLYRVCGSRIFDLSITQKNKNIMTTEQKYKNYEKTFQALNDAIGRLNAAEAAYVAAKKAYITADSTSQPYPPR